MSSPTKQFKTIAIIFIISLFHYFIINVFVVMADTQRVTQELPAHRSGELLVKLKNSEKIYKFQFNSDEKLQELIEFYNSQPEIEYVEPNYTYQANMEPLDSYYTEQIYLTQIKANLAWNITTGDDKVTIAILDSGIDIDHPDLKNNIWQNLDEIPNNNIDDDENGRTDDVYGWDFLTNTNDPRPKLEGDYTKIGIKHGTVIAGIAAAQGGNNKGIAGVTWHAKIMSLKVLDGQGTGDTLTVAQAVDYAREKGADIINLSFVGEGRSLTLEKAIEKAYQSGILVVAAAGNEVSEGVNMDELPRYPACHNGPNGENWVIAVASIDKNDKLASFSNYGKNCIDLVAPGVGLFSTVYHNDNYFDFKEYYENGWTGTSVSAPQISGAAALIKSLKPDLSLEQVRNLLLDNADNVDDKNKNYQKLLGSGRLNVFAAISQSLTQTPTRPLELDKIITSPAENGGPHVRIFKKTLVENQFFAFDEKFRGNLSVSSGDVDNDGNKEIVVGLGQGTYPWVKIFDQKGNLENKIVAYDEHFKGGVEVALGDVDSDGRLEIITAAGQGGGPHIRIFNHEGKLEAQFFAFDKNERTGLEVASGDLNGDGQDEIVVTKKSGLPEVRVFNKDAHLLAKFIVYQPNFQGGVHLAVDDLDNDNQAEIITGAGLSGGPHIKIFDIDGNLKSQFFSYAQNFRGGSYVAVGDVDKDGNNEIITGAGPSGGPHVRVFDINGKIRFQFFAYDERFRGGVRVASSK